MDFRLRLSTTARFSTPSKRCQGRRSIDVLKRPTAGFEPVMVCLPPPLLRWLALHRHHQRPAQAAEGPRDWKSVSIHPQQTSGQARLSGAAGGKVRRPQTGGGDQAAHPTGQTSADRDCPGTPLIAFPCRHLSGTHFHLPTCCVSSQPAALQLGFASRPKGRWLYRLATSRAG